MTTFKLPFVAHRVLVVANAHADLSAWLLERRPTLELRGKRLAEVTADDLQWADTYVGFKRPAHPDMGSVRWVHCTGAGVDAWLYPEPIDEKVLLTRTSESFGPMIAEWVMARVLAFRQQLLPLAEAQREKRWAPRDVPRLEGTRALVLGMGNVGRSVAHYLLSFDVDVTGLSRSGQSDSPRVRSVFPVEALPDIVRHADWLIVTLPLTHDTRGLVSRDVLSKCRNTFLINTGRGPVVDESAIPEALDAGWLSGCALDVFVEEPLPVTSPLWSDPRVMVSPHVSGLTTVEGAGTGFLECAAALERGVFPRWVVNRSRGY